MLTFIVNTKILGIVTTIPSITHKIYTDIINTKLINVNININTQKIQISLFIAN